MSAGLVGMGPGLVGMGVLRGIAPRRSGLWPLGESSGIRDRILVPLIRGWLTTTTPVRNALLHRP